MKRFTFLSIIFFLNAAWSTTTATTATAPADEAIIELHRSLPHMQELILIHHRDGIENVSTNTNLFMPGRIETGIFERRSSNLFSQAKTLTKTLAKEKHSASEGPTPSFHPHAWRVRVFGKELPAGSPRVREAIALVRRELKNHSEWKSVSTVTAAIKPPHALFTYRKQGQPDRVEKKPMFSVCRSVDGNFGCESTIGFVFL